MNAYLGELRPLLRVALPVVIGQLGMVAMGVVDLIVIGRVGAVELAAVGLGHTWSFGVMVLGIGAAQGIDPLVTVAFGAGKPREAGRAAVQGAVLLLGLGVVLIALHLLSRPFLVAFQQPPEVVGLTVTYCSVISAGVLPFLGFTLVRQLLQGASVTRQATVVILLGNVVNLVADVVLVVWWDGGVAGVAWATTLVRWTMLAALMAWVWGTLQTMRPEKLSVSWSEVVALGGVAVPVAFGLAAEVWAFTGASLVAGSLGAEEGAAHTVALSLASLAFMLPMGVSAAAATRVGNLVGAGKVWRYAAGTSFVLGLVLMAAPSASFLIAPRAVASLYGASGTVLALTAAILPIAGGFALFDSTQVVAHGVLRGLGDTRFPFAADLVCHWAIGLPLGWWLAIHGGWHVAGVWVGLTVGLAGSSLVLGARVLLHGRRSAQLVSEGVV